MRSACTAKGHFNVKRQFLCIGILTLNLLLGCNKSYDPEPEPPTFTPPTNSVLQPQEFSENGYKVFFTNNDASFSMSVRQKMVKTFFAVYPKLVSRYNLYAAKSVTFAIDQNYNGAAYASGTKATFSATWMRDNPNDTDIVTHEIMHIVQAYPSGAGPGWLTEGIADYVRYKYGVDNGSGGWSLPEFSSNQYYTNSYRITARFLVWLELHIRDTIVDELNAAMHSKTYSPDSWKEFTGKTVDELWQTYSVNSKL